MDIVLFTISLVVYTIAIRKYGYNKGYEQGIKDNQLEEFNNLGNIIKKENEKLLIENGCTADVCNCFAGNNNWTSLSNQREQEEGCIS